LLGHPGQVTGQPGKARSLPRGAQYSRIPRGRQNQRLHARPWCPGPARPSSGAPPGWSVAYTAPMNAAAAGRSHKAGSKPGKGSYDVAVVGRGAVGTAVALAFARAGRRVALVAPGDTPAGGGVGNAAPQAVRGADDWDTRVFAISPSSRSLLLELGAWQLMEASRLATVHDMRLFNDAAGLVTRERAEVRLDAYQGRVEALAWIVENRELQQALDRAIALSLPTGML